jgi:hypothetical protein
MSLTLNFLLKAQKMALVRANGVLDKGSLSSLTTELRNFIPSILIILQITNLDTEIDLTLKASQRTKMQNWNLKQNFLHQTEVLLASLYPLYIHHFIFWETRIDYGRTFTHTVWNQRHRGRVVLTGITDKMVLEPVS